MRSVAHLVTGSGAVARTQERGEVRPEGVIARVVALSGVGALPLCTNGLS